MAKSTPVPVAGSVLIGPGDSLTIAQRERLFRAVAILLADREALRSGMSSTELESQTWLVEVNPL